MIVLFKGSKLSQFVHTLRLIPCLDKNWLYRISCTISRCYRNNAGLVTKAINFLSTYCSYISPNNLSVKIFTFICGHQNTRVWNTFNRQRRSCFFFCCATYFRMVFSLLRQYLLVAFKLYCWYIFIELSKMSNKYSLHVDFQFIVIHATYLPLWLHTQQKKKEKPRGRLSLLF